MIIEKMIPCPTWKVTAQYLHPHADPCWRPPLWIQPDVVGHHLVKMAQLRGVVVCVSLENLSGTRKNNDSVTIRLVFKRTNIARALSPHLGQAKLAVHDEIPIFCV